MARLVISTFITVNGAFDSPAPDNWLVLDNDSGDDALNLLVLGDALLLGRRTYEGLSVVWPNLTEDPDLGRFADRINSMPKYVASRTLTGPLEWNAKLLDGDLESAVNALKDEHSGNIVVSGTGELAHTLARGGLIDEYWIWVHPYLWADGPRVFEGIGPMRMELVAATPYSSGVVCLRYRPADTAAA
jgi:dihydrofolate reductase